MPTPTQTQQESVTCHRQPCCTCKHPCRPSRPAPSLYSCTLVATPQNPTRLCTTSTGTANTDIMCRLASSCIGSLLHHAQNTHILQSSHCPSHPINTHHQTKPKTTSTQQEGKQTNRANPDTNATRVSHLRFSAWQSHETIITALTAVFPDILLAAIVAELELVKYNPPP